MQMLPYDHNMVHWFSKETDYVIRLRNGRLRIAGLFLNGGDEYKWITAEQMKVIRGEDIVEYMPITT